MERKEKLRKGVNSGELEIGRNRNFYYCKVKYSNHTLNFEHSKKRLHLDVV